MVAFKQECFSVEVPKFRQLGILKETKICRKNLCSNWPFLKVCCDIFEISLDTSPNHPSQKVDDFEIEISKEGHVKYQKLHC